MGRVLSNPPFSDRGVSQRGCRHRDTWVCWIVTNATSGVAVLRIEARNGSTSAEHVEWCRDCGALRFASGERFIVPMRARIGEAQL